MTGSQAWDGVDNDCDGMADEGRYLCGAALPGAPGLPAELVPSGLAITEVHLVTGGYVEACHGGSTPLPLHGLTLRWESGASSRSVVLDAAPLGDGALHPGQCLLLAARVGPGNTRFGLEGEDPTGLYAGAAVLGFDPAVLDLQPESGVLSLAAEVGAVDCDSASGSCSEWCDPSTWAAAGMRVELARLDVTVVPELDVPCPGDLALAEALDV
ncbi:hypothetical protein L6R53_33560, partial [Myxococcota bacterium]|nr:hypothetical protein [Myxococcota bacterium]